MSKRDTRRKRAKWRNRPRGQLGRFYFDEMVKFKPRVWRYIQKILAKELEASWRSA